MMIIFGALRDLAPCAQFKKREKHPWRSVTFSKVAGLGLRLKPATLLNVTLLHGCFSRFLNCMRGTKSRKAPHVVHEISIDQCFDRLTFFCFITSGYLQLDFLQTVPYPWC